MTNMTCATQSRHQQAARQTRLRSRNSFAILVLIATSLTKMPMASAALRGSKSLEKLSHTTDAQGELELQIRSTDSQRQLHPQANEIKGKKRGFGQCEGDCDSDKDCDDGLVCVQRERNDPIPGCDAPMHIIEGKSDFCLLPRDVDAISKTTGSGDQLQSKWLRDNPKEYEKKDEDKLGECEGDCDIDDDCRGNLVCQQRDHHQSYDGCSGGSKDKSEADYCVQPHLHMKFGDLFEKDDDASSPRSSYVVPNNSGGGPRVVATSSAYGSKGKFKLEKPSNVKEGDLLVLFLSRSDDPLPLKMSGWSTEASCFKHHNGQSKCFTADMCSRRADYDDDYCAYFGDEKRNGQDLATVVYTRRATRHDVDHGDKDFVKIDLRGTHSNKHPGWAILSNIRNASGVRDWIGVSCDASDHAVFDSVSNAESGDLLLMEFTFDDATTTDRFQAPSGSKTVAYVVGEDETGILYAQEGLSSGPTGKRETRGDGASDCKDLNLSLVIRG